MVRPVRVYIFALVTVTVFALFLRFYDLDNTPPGYTWDEASITYNAWSIQEWRRDENAIFMPLSFRSFGDYKPPAFIYFMSLVFLLFPLDPFYTRLTGAIFGFGFSVLAGLLTFSLARHFDPKPAFRLCVGAISYALVALSPWSIHLARIGFEQNMTVFLITLGMWLLTLEKLTTKRLLGGFAALTLSLYTFHTAKIAVPLLLIWWFLTLGPGQRRKLLNRVVISFLLMALAVFPLIYDSFTVSGLARASNLIVFDLNGELNSITDVFYQLARNIKGQTFPRFWLEGWDRASDRNSVKGIAPMHLVNYWVLIIAFLWSISSKRRFKKMWLWWLLATVGMAPALLSWFTPNYLRSLWAIVPLSLILSIFVMSFLKLQMLKKARYSLLVIMVLMYGISTFKFAQYYFGPEYSRVAAADFQYGYEELFSMLSSLDNGDEKVIISGYYGQPYIYALLYNHIHPQNYQFGALNKYTFEGLIYSTKLEPDAIYAAPPQEISPEDPRVLEVIKAPKSETIVWVIAKS